MVGPRAARRDRLASGERGGIPARQLAAAAWDRGLLVYPVGGPEGQGDLVVLAPPLTIRRDDLAEIGHRLLSAFA